MRGTDKVAEGRTSCGSNESINISGALTVKSESFVLYVKDNDQNYQTSCTATTSVADIGLTCSNNGSFHIDVANPCQNNACAYEVKKTYKGTTTSLSGASGQNLGNASYNFDFTGYGTYVLWVNGEATDCSVAMSINKPSFSCPTAVGVTIGDPVTFTLGSVTGCDENENDCSYAIGGTSVTGTAYKSGALTAFTDNTVTTAGTKSYTVELTNESGTTSHDCSVVYDAGNTGGGNATCKVRNNNNKDSVMVGETNLKLSVSGMKPAPTSDVKIPMICANQTLAEPLCRTGGSCDDVNFTAPSTPGKYICSFQKDGFNPCKTLPTFYVVPPVSCSISEENVAAGTQITFSGTANTNYGAQSNSCGFKINGNWLNNDQNQNFTTKTLNYTVNSTTTFSVVCTQGQAPEATRICSKTVTVY